MLIELMWEEYLPAIKLWGFYPYCINLIVLFMLTSWSSASYIENMMVVEELEGSSYNLGTDAPGSMIEGGEAASNLEDIFKITFVLCIIEFIFCIISTYREAKQIRFLGIVNYMTD
jgi:hypothetical protein